MRGYRIYRTLRWKLLSYAHVSPSPKLAHLLRTCPPTVILGALERFDEIMREAVSDLADCPLPNWSWLKASLPSSLGGLNIRQAALHAPASFIGSLHQPEYLIRDILG